MMGRVFTNDPGDWGSIPGQVIQDLKMILDASLFNTALQGTDQGQVDQSRERSSALPYTLVEKLLKMEPSSCPRLWSANLYKIKFKFKFSIRRADFYTDYINIVAGVMQGDTLAPYLFIICLDYVLRTSIDKIKDNSFKLRKERSRRYPTQTMTDTDYAKDIVLLANTPVQAETLLYSLERAAACIGLHVNAHKTEYMCFNQRGDIFTLSSSSLKLVDKFTYLGSSISSAKTDINTRLAKAWTAIDKLSVIWKSDLTDKMKRSFFSSSGHVDTGIWMHYMDAN